jgi:hypothetical protein
MKKLAPLFLIVLLVAFTAPALAGNGDLEWAATKTVALTETFTYTETVAFQGAGNFVFDGEAWAKIQEQQELYSLTLNENNIVTTDNAVKAKSASISTSFNSGTGIANVNQAPGNMNNQGNEVALSLGTKGTPAGTVTIPPDFFEGMYCEAQVVSVQYNGILFTPNNPTTDQTPDLGGTRINAANTYNTGGFDKSDTISESFNGFSGIANVNQSAGSLNNQGNAVAIAGGVDQVLAKAATSVMLAQANAYNTMTESTAGPNIGAGAGNTTNDTISNNAFGGAFGVFNVNQSSGSLNNQKNVVAIGFSGPVSR